MKYEVNFGQLPNAEPTTQDACFRIAVLGDLSGRANQGKLDTGDALAKRKPLRVDVDNLDDIIEQLDVQLHLPIGDDGGSVQVPLTEMDDFHPDQLYEQLEIFSKLSGLHHKLADSATFAGAARAVQSLLGGETPPSGPARRQAARGTSVPNAKISDFASLVGRPTSEDPKTPINDLIKQLIRPHISAETDPRQEEMIAMVDEALSDTMRRVLHHPDFQTMESIWRGIEMLVRRLETDTTLQIVLYDISAEEIAADLSATSDLQETGLYKLLVEHPALDEQQGPISVMIGSYVFEQTPPHADLLGRMAKICAAMRAPFIAATSNECLKKLNPEDIHPIVKQSWDQLHALPESGYLSLTAPRFMLRWPYGKKTEPIDSFDFEEFTKQVGVGSMLWGNSAFIAGLLLGQTCQQQGVAAMKPGDVLTVNDLPFYYYTDDDGDQIALPCTDRLLSERLAAHVTGQNLTPVLSIKGRPEVRLGGFRSLGGVPLIGRWADAPATSSGTVVAPSTSAAVAPTLAQEATPQDSAIDQSDATDDLDELLAGLDDLGGSPNEDATAETPVAAGEPDDNSEAESADDELDALLADLDGGSQPAEDDEMDSDLAALLADL